LKRKKREPLIQYLRVFDKSHYTTHKVAGRKREEMKNPFKKTLSLSRRGKNNKLIKLKERMSYRKTFNDIVVYCVKYKKKMPPQQI
jgi:hypothetical protein